MNKFILLHEKYKFSNPIENEDNSEYHYYKLLIINNIEYQNYIRKETYEIYKNARGRK